MFLLLWYSRNNFNKQTIPLAFLNLAFQASWVNWKPSKMFNNFQFLNSNLSIWIRRSSLNSKKPTFMTSFRILAELRLVSSLMHSIISNINSSLTFTNSYTDYSKNIRFFKYKCILLSSSLIVLTSGLRWICNRMILITQIMKGLSLQIFFSISTILIFLGSYFYKSIQNNWIRISQIY